MKRALIAGLVAAAGVGQTAAQDPQAWVSVIIAGHEVMGFAPRSEPYTQGGPGVCSQVDESNARTKAGLSVRGFEFIGWREGEGFRVFAFAIVADPAGSRGLCSEGKGFRKIDFGTVLVRVGQDVVFERMKDVGVAPWTIRARMKSPAPSP